MTILLLTYELSREFDPNFDYSNFRKLRDGFSPVKLSESTYVLKTSKEPSEIRHKLQESLHADDNLYIITLKKPYSSRGLKKAVKWLDNNLAE